MTSQLTTATPTGDAPTVADATTAATATSRPRDTTTMRAVVRERYGEPGEVMSVGDVARPTAGDGQVLVEVDTAGLDRGTWHLVTGLPYLLRLMGYGLRAPNEPVVGAEVAGRVVAVGADVTRVRPGDRVFGVARGAFAEFAVVEVDKVAVLPDEVSFEQGALAAISGATALEAVEDVAEVRAGQSVLVIGASGGVGTAAVQLAVAAGAAVTGVASTAKLDTVRRLGADDVIDYTAGDWLDTDQRWDVVLDVGGRHPVSRLRRLLARDGTLVFVGGEGGDRVIGGMGRTVRGVVLSPFVSQRLSMFISSEHHSILERVAAHLASGALAPVVDRQVGLDGVPSAIDDLVAGHVVGKVAVAVGRRG